MTVTELTSIERNWQFHQTFCLFLYCCCMIITRWTVLGTRTPPAYHAVANITLWFASSPFQRFSKTRWMYKSLKRLLNCHSIFTHTPATLAGHMIVNVSLWSEYNGISRKMKKGSHTSQKPIPPNLSQDPRLTRLHVILFQSIWCE